MDWVGLKWLRFASGRSLLLVFVLTVIVALNLGSWAVSLRNQSALLELEGSATRAYCRPIRHVKSYRFPKSAGSEVHILFPDSAECNAFHQLWTYLALVRDVFRYPVHYHAANLPHPLQVYVAVNECATWLETMIQAFPVSSDRVSIHTELVSEEAFEGHYQANHSTTQQNCISVK